MKKIMSMLIVMAIITTLLSISSGACDICNPGSDRFYASMDITNKQLSDFVKNEIIPYSVSYFEMRDSMVSDISPLGKLEYLRMLVLPDNQIKNIPLFNEDVYLWELELTNNHISDITNLSGLSNLAALFMNTNRVTDISPLENLEWLYYVDISNNFLDLDDSATQESIAKIQETIDRNEGVFVYEPQRNPADYPEPVFYHGRILKSSYDSDRVVVGDAIEILKYLAKMESLVKKENEREWNAAMITSASQKAGKPAIADALEILKKLARMESLVR